MVTYVVWVRDGVELPFCVHHPVAPTQPPSAGNRQRRIRQSSMLVHARLIKDDLNRHADRRSAMRNGAEYSARSRSPRSSQRSGKPATGRRGTVYSSRHGAVLLYCPRVKLYVF